MGPTQAGRQRKRVTGHFHQGATHPSHPHLLPAALLSPGLTSSGQFSPRRRPDSFKRALSRLTRLLLDALSCVTPMAGPPLCCPCWFQRLISEPLLSGNVARTKSVLTLVPSRKDGVGSTKKAYPYTKEMDELNSPFEGTQGPSCFARPRCKVCH